MVIDNCLDLYDMMITNSLLKKFTSVEKANFQYAPNDNFAFSMAKENFGEKIFPLYNIFRVDPPLSTNDNTSYVNFSRNFNINEDCDINHLLLEFVWDINFYSDNMYDMNKSIFDYYRFKSAPSLEMNLNDVGYDINYLFEARLDPPDQNNNIDQQLESGLFFNYTYKMTCRLLLLEKIKPIKYTLNFKLVDYKARNEYYNSRK